MNRQDKALEKQVVSFMESNYTAKADTAEGETTPSHATSPHETNPQPIRVELPPSVYVTLAKRAAQEGMTTELLVAQTVSKLLQEEPKR